MVVVPLAEQPVPADRNPADYLSVETVNDDVLAPYRRGRLVLTSGLGTAGVTSRRGGHRGLAHDNTAPWRTRLAIVATETGLGVYNLGLGDGPNRNYELLNTRAFSSFSPGGGAPSTWEMTSRTPS